MAAALDAAGIPYMITGSYASSYHGAPRATQDVDLVAAPTAPQLADLIRGLPREIYYVDEGAALEALRNESLFNVIDVASGWKVDVIIRKSRPFSREEFERRVPADLHGNRLYMASAEDVLLAKLEWAKRGSSERQIEDAAGILRIRWDQLDHAYLRRWVVALDVEPGWAAALRAAGREGPAPESTGG
jgi:hypothetical protein